MLSVASRGTVGRMQWWRRRELEIPAELSELVVLLEGVGSIPMGIDAKLELIVDHVEGEDDDGD